jgi:hypothetical protein
MNEMIEVTKHDANNYCLVLRALGMEEEGDPVAEIDRLKAENSELRKDAEWRPIETAPEGVSVLAVNDCGYIGRAMKERGRWNHIGSPIGWKPLPAPPRKPLFEDLIAQHPGLREELSAMDAQPADWTEQTR